MFLYIVREPAAAGPVAPAHNSYALCTGTLGAAAVMESGKHEIEEVGRSVISDDRAHPEPVILVVVVEVAVAKIQFPRVIIVGRVLGRRPIVTCPSEIETRRITYSNFKNILKCLKYPYPVTVRFDCQLFRLNFFSVYCPFMQKACPLCKARSNAAYPADSSI